MPNALDVQTLHLDCGHDGNLTTECYKTLGLTDIVRAKKRGKGRPDHETVHPGPVPARRTHNSWASNFGELRRSTDGFFPQRLAVALILTVNWSHGPSVGLASGTYLRALKGWTT